ncbi:MAG: hypothetical protein ABL877_03165 [Thiobacillus sp.]
MHHADTTVLLACLKDDLSIEQGVLTDALNIDQYDLLYPQIEQRMWQGDDAAFAHWLGRYQALFREQQALIDASDLREQHHFIIGIPVAGRPAHLRHCLDSILQQCHLFGYGGQDAGGRYAKFTVIVSEDSRDAEHRAQHQALVAEYCDKGLSVVHYDLPEQVQLLQAIPDTERAQLGRLLTTQPADRFYQKGQAANRNLCYLKMRQLTQDTARTLYYLVDSDQLFLVNRQTAEGERAYPALNYFYTLDRIFRTQPVSVLTGKLVGDPPVSPAVMAANFLDDVTAFLQRIATLDSHAACSFHPQNVPLPDDAAYHDLASRFGFDAPTQAVDYRCPLEGAHDHAACLSTFSARLHNFFFGEHLTRKTGFRYAGSSLALSPARTIYPGNTIVNFEGLKTIIPFGHLRLRMSGPTAGRLIQAEIGSRFASVNLPMLHKRTIADAQDAFRPGVEQHNAAIDISDEFERQFFGDLMLFSVVAWLKDHRLDDLSDSTQLDTVVEQVEAGLLVDYADKHRAVNDRREALERWLDARPGWPDPSTHARLTQFLRNIAANFGDASPAWTQIQSAAHRQQRRQQIVDALRHYRRERDAWDRLFSQ